MTTTIQNDIIEYEKLERQIAEEIKRLPKVWHNWPQYNEHGRKRTFRDLRFVKGTTDHRDDNWEWDDYSAMAMKKKKPKGPREMIPPEAIYGPISIMGLRRGSYIRVDL